MTAILSCTSDDLYLFNLPFAVYSWHKIGVNCKIAVPKEMLFTSKLELVIGYIRGPGTSHWLPFTCSPDKEATYAQCARLYAAALPAIPGDEVLITSDADMCVFNTDYWTQLNSSGVVVTGADLVPEGQVPMCYLSGSAERWRTFMQIKGRSYQQCLDDLLRGIETENFRGNYWAKDQETAYNHLENFPHLRISRAYPGTQFATRRTDRDSWPVNIPLDIIDAHLPRPGYVAVNFNKIYQLFHTMYVNEDLRWMLEYYTQYTKLMGI